jgi:hypothetical protein
MSSIAENLERVAANHARARIGRSPDELIGCDHQTHSGWKVR